MQEALIKTYRYAGASGARGVPPVLYRTVRNACLMHRRLRVDEPRSLLSLDGLMPTREGMRPIDAPDGGRTRGPRREHPAPAPAGRALQAAGPLRIAPSSSCGKWEGLSTARSRG